MALIFHKKTAGINQTAVISQYKEIYVEKDLKNLIYKQKAQKNCWNSDKTKLEAVISKESIRKILLPISLSN